MPYAGLCRVGRESYTGQKSGDTAMHKLSMRISCLLSLIIGTSSLMAADPALGQQQPAQPAQAQPRAPRPGPAARDPNSAGFVKAKELEDGEVPSAEEDGNFVIGPTHKKAAEMNAKEGVPKGQSC